MHSGKSVVIDNTNPEPATRQSYIALAKEKGIPVRCFHFETPEELTHHLNLFREVRIRIRRGRLYSHLVHRRCTACLTSPESRTTCARRRWSLPTLPRAT